MLKALYIGLLFSVNVKDRSEHKWYTHKKKKQPHSDESAVTSRYKHNWSAIY